MKGIREMAQSLRALAAGPENMGTVPSTASWLTLILGALSLSFELWGHYTPSSSFSFLYNSKIKQRFYYDNCIV